MIPHGWIAAPAPVMMAEVNEAAPLLFWTGVRLVAGNYHSDSRAIEDDYLFYRDTGQRVAADIAKARGVDYVMLCAKPRNFNYAFTSLAIGRAEYRNHGKAYTPQQTLYTRLADGKPPDWLTLQPWPDDVRTQLRLYRVDRPKLEQALRTAGE